MSYDGLEPRDPYAGGGRPTPPDGAGEETGPISGLGGIGGIGGIEFESPTEQLPIVRLSSEQEHLLERLRRRSPRADDAGEAPAAAATTGVRGRQARYAMRRRRRRWFPAYVRRGLIAAVSFTLLLGLTSAVIAGVAYQKYNGQIKRIAVLQTTDSNIREAARQENAVNFLVIGSDTRAGADSQYGNVDGARSDTNIIIHVSPDHQHVTVISIPRDSFVTIPACKQSNGQIEPEHQDLFNSAFSIGGPTCTIATVQKLTGIEITHYLEIDFSGFANMVNAMGTVTICSPQTVHDPYSGLNLKKGDNALNGGQALAYVRARETLGDGSDLQRIERQQMFLGAVLRQAMNGNMLSNPVALTKFLDAATKSITVDKGTSFEDLRSLAESMQGLDPAHVVFYTAPIANPDYHPPGYDYYGKVLLDPVAGGILYNQVINDDVPVWVTSGSGSPSVAASSPSVGTSSTSTTTSSTSTSPSTSPSGTDVPHPNGTAADNSCKL